MDKIRSYLDPIISSIPFWWIVFYIGITEIVSYSGSVFPTMNRIGFFTIIILTFLYSMRDLRYGIFVLLVELFIGSKGYMFSQFVGDFEVSIRLALFLTVFLAYGMWVLRERKVRFFSWALRQEFMVLFGLVAFGTVVGVLRGYPLQTIFLDMNGWLYLGLILPLTQAVHTKRHRQQLIGILFASVVAVAVKTVFLLALFSQTESLPYILPGIYSWVRDSGVGEITQFDNGFSRIFFQSHIFMLIGFFLLAPWFPMLTRTERKRDKRALRAATLLLGATMLITFLSYSRSFWVAGVATWSVMLGWLLLKEHIGLRRAAWYTLFLGVLFAVNYAFAFGIVNVPLPGNAGVSAESLIAERVQKIGSEPAAATRWQSLQPLLSDSFSSPLIGSGLGASVTYTSADPRVLEDSPTGEYTTTAFEWGYLDMLLKFGLVGVLALAFFVFQLFQLLTPQPHHQLNDRIEGMGLSMATLALLLTHIFTPYLNHPLGIGWILIVSIIAVGRKKQLAGKS